MFDLVAVCNLVTCLSTVWSAWQHWTEIKKKKSKAAKLKRHNATECGGVRQTVLLFVAWCNSQSEQNSIAMMLIVIVQSSINWPDQQWLNFTVHINNSRIKPRVLLNATLRGFVTLKWYFQDHVTSLPLNDKHLLTLADFKQRENGTPAILPVTIQWTVKMVLKLFGNYTASLKNLQSALREFIHQTVTLSKWELSVCRCIKAKECSQ